MSRRPPPHSQWGRRKEQSRSQPRRPLTPEERDILSSQMRTSFNWENDPRPFQLEAVCAQLEEKDMILQAPTGSGKTAIAAGPHLWPTSKGKMTIMVSPLLALEEEMVREYHQ